MSGCRPTTLLGCTAARRTFYRAHALSTVITQCVPHPCALVRSMVRSERLCFHSSSNRPPHGTSTRPGRGAFRAVELGRKAQARALVAGLPLRTGAVPYMCALRQAVTSQRVGTNSMNVAEASHADVIDLDCDDELYWRFGECGWEFSVRSGDANEADLKELQARADKGDGLHSCMPRRLTARLLLPSQLLARSWRGDCLSIEDIGKAQWQCSRGHVWTAPADAVKLCAVWCPRWVCQRGKHPAEVAVNTLAGGKGGPPPPLAVLRQMAAASGCVSTNPVASTDTETVRSQCGLRPTGCMYAP